MVNSGSLPTSKMEFSVMIVNSIAKNHILDVQGVSGYITVIIGFWYSADVLPRWKLVNAYMRVTRPPTPSQFLTQVHWPRGK